MNTGRKRRVAVCDKSDLLIRACSAYSFNHGRYSGLSVSVVGDVVSGDLKAFRGDKEEDVIVFAQDLDIGFITCTDVIDRAFILEVKAMAVKGGSFSIIEDSLIRDLDVKD